MTAWIDTHVHLFLESDAKKEWPRLARYHNRVNTPSVYRSANGEDKPCGIVVVHFSKAADSAHVIETLDSMRGCRMPVAGVIKADIADPRTFQWILRDDVKGVRIYAKESVPDFSDKAAWNRLFNLLRSQRKHLLVFGEAPYLRETIAALPQDISLVIDHLGLPNAAKGANDHDFRCLLSEMRSRNLTAAPVYYKGPGYRTALDARKVQPFVDAIVETLGVERLMLGASDAPFAGMPVSVDFPWIRDYTRCLALETAKTHGLNEQDVLFRTHNGNAASLYGFDAK